MKYNKETVERICELIRSDSYTILEICKQVGISKQTYYNWIDNEIDFLDSIKKAKGHYDEFVISEAKKSLIKKIKGYEYEEKTTEVDVNQQGEAKATKVRTIKKHAQPDTAAIIFTLCNKAPNEYQNKYNTELTGKNGKDLIPEITVRIIDDKDQLNGNTNDKNIQASK